MDDGWTSSSSLTARLDVLESAISVAGVELGIVTLKGF